eukprot:SAG25_NODE_382_length_8794_cov_3.620012_6_plen_84_part_00
MRARSVRVSARRLPVTTRVRVCLAGWLQVPSVCTQCRRFAADIERVMDGAAAARVDGGRAKRKNQQGKKRPREEPTDTGGGVA